MSFALHLINFVNFQFEYGASWERPNLCSIWEAQVISSAVQDLI
jgi:hypothetical protein